MCIIVYSPDGDIVKNSILRNCFANHRDGAGIMVRCSSGIAFMKGLMNLKDLKKTYKEIMEMFPNAEHAIHFRTGTSGKDAFGCTHPFPLSEDRDDLHVLSGIAKRTLMHNGILSHGHEDLSDTQLYVKDILYPMRHILGRQPIQDMIEDHIGGYNKFLIFDKDDTYLLGHWVGDDNFWYSNEDYKPKKIQCVNSSWWEADEKGVIHRKDIFECYDNWDHSGDWLKDVELWEDTHDKNN